MKKSRLHTQHGCHFLQYPDSSYRWLTCWEWLIKHRLFGWTAQDFVDEETGANLFRRYCDEQNEN